MKKIFVSLFALGAIITSAAAQDQPQTDSKQDRKEWKEGHKGGKKMHHDRGDALKQLNLTSDQQQKMKSLNQDFRTKMQSLDKGTSASKSQREALVNEHQAAIQALLTSDQRIQLEKIKAEAKEKRGDRPVERGQMKDKRGKHDDARLDKMKSELNLTDAQVAQLNSSKEKSKAEMKAIAADQSLSQEQKKDKMQSVREQSKQSMSSILTQEQKSKMETMKGDRPERKRKAQ